MNDQFLQMVPNRLMTPSLTNFVRLKFGVGSSLARPCLAVNFCHLPVIVAEGGGGGGGGGLDFLSSKGCTGAEWHKGGHAQVTLTNDRAPRLQNGNGG